MTDEADKMADPASIESVERFKTRDGQVWETRKRALQHLNEIAVTERCYALFGGGEYTPEMIASVLMRDATVMCKLLMNVRKPEER